MSIHFKYEYSKNIKLSLLSRYWNINSYSRNLLKLFVSFYMLYRNEIIEKLLDTTKLLLFDNRIRKWLRY